jgi:hypothetical protein
MEISALTGSRLTVPPWDTDGNGVINNNDLLPDGTPPGGQEVEGGAGTPTVITDGQREFKIFSVMKDAQIKKIDESVPPSPTGSRQAWMQVVQ